DTGNIIAMNGDDGVQVSNASLGNSILGNSIYGHNTDGTTIGIDLNITIDGPDPNDGATNAAQPNNGMDLPVITTAQLSGGNLTLDGYVGNMPASPTFSNARVEFFISSNNPTGWGEGQTYLNFLTTNASSQFSGSFAVVGVNVGDEITATATDPSGNTSEFSLNVTVTGTSTITGTVFEDINYGGGDGRDYTTADASAQTSGWAAGAVGSGPNVVVELYREIGGAFIRINQTNTDANGDYSFTIPADDTYRVRVVNGTVVSNRGFNATGNTPLAVQTFRNDPDSGGAVVNEVGGADPADQDDGVQANGVNIAMITAQSVTEIVIAGASVANVDFGFNFDTIVNTNNSGQGSLRQFLLNSNELDNTNLDQQDNPSGVTAVTKSAGDEHSIFMIPIGELQGTIDGGGGTVMLIQTTSALPTITDSDTAVDGSTQTAYTGDTNSAVAETTTGPEVIVDLQRTVSADALAIDANAVIIDTLGLTGTQGGGTNGVGIETGVTNTIVRNSTLFSTGASTLKLEAGAANNQILNNVMRNGGLDVATADGLALDGNNSGNTFSGNQIVANAGYGIDVVNGGNDGNTISNNLIKGNGTSGSQLAGIAIRGGDNNAISQNTITANAGAGIFVNDGESGNQITQNSIYNNGALGADMNAGTGATGDGVSANDNLDPDGGGNNRQNFPAITSAIWNGANTVVQGTLNSTAGAAFDIEVFSNTVCNGDTGGVAQVDTYGEGETYRATDNVTTDGVSGNTTFSVTIPVDLTGQYITATAINTATNDTSEFSQCQAATGLISIAGTVYEDPNGDANMADQVARDNVTVALYRDGGDNQPDGVDDTFINTTTTAGGGVYSFSGLRPATYWVVVDSKTVSPTAAYNVGFGAGDVWAEQTYGIAGAWCANGSGGTAEIGAAGACFGGQDAAASDNISAPIDVADLPTAEHVTRVVAAADVNGVDFGFSFNVVVATRDGDDDVSNNRTIQGSL
ncbi:MAG: right-handed parallel beta-helix repeat-containing protein, partial [Desulfobacterales bacterium]